MNIIEAAQQLKSGRKICLEGWAPGVHYQKLNTWNGRVVLDFGDGELSQDLELLVEDLLSEKWTVVNE